MKKRIGGWLNIILKPGFNKKDMDRRDYYVEYYEVLDRVLSDYVNHLREEKEYWLKIGRHDVGVPLINLLFWQFTWHRDCLLYTSPSPRDRG